MRARWAAHVCAVLLATPFAIPTARAQLHAAIEHDGEARNDEPPAEASARADAESAPNTGHVPPAPPQHTMAAMTPAQMVDVMGMDDDATFAMLLVDRLERTYGDDSSTAWNVSGWVGRDFDKLWLKSEGNAADGRVEHGDVQALWSHAVAPFWDTQLGVRRDVGEGADRNWAAFGVQGLAPYWFDIAATAYVGTNGRTALRLEGEYDLRLTQKWILQPRAELNAYGKADPARALGAGISDAAFGLRLRYEIHREFAPYIGVEWTKRFGATADFARTNGASAFDAQLVVGVRVWL